MSFWKELSRRNVFKVGIAYAIVAWLIIHPVDIIFPTLHLPEWTTTFVTALFIIGFPFVLLFSWAYEITPKGLKKTKDVALSKSITHVTGRRLNFIITGLLMIALAYFVFDKYYNMRTSLTTPAVSTAAKAKKSIAVLPFIDLSPGKDQEYFVDGLSEELLNSLSQLPDLTVIARTSSFIFKGSNKKIQEIANELGVENILEGSVRKAGNALRITAQLVSAADGSHLWSNTYDREMKDIFTVQEDIAAAVAGELKTTLGIDKSLRKLGNTDNTKAYELYMTAQGLYNGGPDNLSKALSSINDAIALDPKYALAWASKSVIHNGLSTFVTSSRAEEQNAGLQAALRAIELEPKLAAGYYSLGVTRMYQGQWIEAEVAYRRALALTTEPLLQYKVVHPFHYQCVANFKRASEILAAYLQNDPLNQINRAEYMSSFIFLNDMQRVKTEYERGKALLGDQWFFGDMAMGDARINSGEVIAIDELLKIFSDDEKLRQRIKSTKIFIAELRRSYANDPNLDSQRFMSISEYAAYLGDSELALDAMEKATSLDYTVAGSIWLPVLKEVRQTPRFKALVKKIGFVDYWNKFGWPDICHQLDNGDFECD